MTGHRVAWFSVAVVAALFVRTAAQEVDRAELLLQAARTKQDVESRPAEAIKLYQQAIGQALATGPLRRRPCWAWRNHYEKLGRPEAQTTYKRLAQSTPTCR